MAETLAINFKNLVSYSTLIVIGGSICNRFDILREASVEIVFFRQVQKSSDPASLTLCGRSIFIRRPTIFNSRVDIFVYYRSLHKYPKQRDQRPRYSVSNMVPRTISVVYRAIPQVRASVAEAFLAIDKRFLVPMQTFWCTIDLCKNIWNTAISDRDIVSQTWSF